MIYRCHLSKVRITIVIAAFCLLFLVSPATADDEVEAPVSRIAFGSCLMPERPHSILSRIVETNPDLFIFTGDNIYADTRRPSVMKRKYRRLSNSPGFGDLSNACRILATWDDHDYGRNDSGAEYVMKIESEKIFEDFYRPDTSLVRSTGGTGIGLALVKKFAVAMGGSVTAANNPGPGCTITISMPS